MEESRDRERDRGRERRREEALIEGDPAREQRDARRARLVLGEGGEDLGAEPLLHRGGGLLERALVGGALEREVRAEARLASEKMGVDAIPLRVSERREVIPDEMTRYCGAIHGFSSSRNTCTIWCIRLFTVPRGASVTVAICS